MIIPQPLCPGDSIGLIAPAGAVPPMHIGGAIQAIEALGFTVEVGTLKSKRYLAGEDHIRASDINMMFARSDIRGIFVMRGGYGAGRLMELLDFELIRNNPKFFAGYSDITALHTVFNQKCGFVTFHAPMAATELCNKVDPYTADMFNRTISGSFRGALVNPAGQLISTLQPGRCTGMLTGGNLSTIVSMLGTPYEIHTTDKILILEDINEEPYRIDRMLNQLRLCGKLHEAAGFVFGCFTGCGSETELLEIFREMLPHGKPAVYNMAVGHCMPTMSLALGAHHTLDAERGIFICVG